MAFLDYSGLSHFLDKIKALFVTGPGSSTDAHVATFDGTTGKKVKDSGYTIGKSVPSNALFTDTTYESKSASSGGTDVSLVTTGEKYTWNNKASSDTKNTAGTTNKTDTKMYLAAATEQSANPQTYSNSNAYIGTDNCLYSGGAKVLTSHQDISGKKNTQSAVSDPTTSGTSVTFIATLSQNTQGVISATKKTVSSMSGATSSAAGSMGLVPAPTAGQQGLYLKGDGTWGLPEGARVFVTDLDDVTNTSGSYTHTTTVQGVTADLKAIQIECSNPEIFKDHINILTATNSITLTCNSVEGTSTVKVSLLVTGNANPLNSSEYAALDARIDSVMPLMANVAFPIPAVGESVSYSMAGITADAQLDRWNFSVSGENAPPCSLTWTTGAGYFTITNVAGVTTETIQPSFIVPTKHVITLIAGG